MRFRTKSLKKAVKRRKSWVAVIAVFFVVVALAFTIYTKIGPGRIEKTMVSETLSAVAERGDISDTVDASGNLEAAETIDVTVPVGVKVKTVLVESGDEVKKGQTLAKLDKTSVVSLLIEVRESLDSIEDKLDTSGLSDLEKEELEGEQSELETVEDELAALQKNPVIAALADGIIGNVNVADEEEVSQDSSNLSGSTEKNSTSSQMSAKEKDSLEILMLTADVSEETDASDDSSGNEIQPEVINDYSKLSVQVPITGAAPQSSIQETDMYKGTITWDCSGKTFQAGTVYTATIVLTAKSGYTFSEKNLPIIKDASFSWNIYNSGEGNTLKIVAKYEKTAEEKNTQGSSSESAKNSNSKQDSSSGQLSKSGKTGSVSGGVSGGAGSGGSKGSSSGTSTETESSSEYYNNYEVSAFTIEKQEQVKIVANVDELDILSVKENQAASVTLDALENEEFEGTVTKVSNLGTASSGSTKYEVEITIPMNENMKIGMSASAVIQVSEAEDTLIIPMTALQQRGESTFVYTEKDENGELSGEVAVETGLSNGNQVEVLSGLEEGDTVYYTRTSENESNSDNGESRFPGGNMNGMDMREGAGQNSKEGERGNNPNGGKKFSGD